MGVFGRITFSNLKKNPIRTLVTIVGIIVSTAMVTALTTFAISLVSYVRNTMKYESGSYHIAYYDSDYQKLEELSKDDRFGEVKAYKSLGYSYTESVNEYKPYTYVISADEDISELIAIHILHGRFPENNGEILVPAHLNSNGGNTYKLGDEIKLSIGTRCDLDGFELGQNNPFSVEVPEQIVGGHDRTYKVVGIYDRLDYAFEDYTAPGYTLITSGENEIPGPYSIFAALPEKDSYSYSEVWGIYKSTDANQLNLNLLSVYGASRYSNINNFIVSIAVIFMLIIIAASITMIYSAISISVSEKTKEFGLLSSIGATGRQIRKMVHLEALFMSVIGIPVGVLCGIIGMGITLYFVGDKFSYFYSSPYNVTLVVKWYAVLFSILLSALTVYVSAFIPAARATRMSTMDAVLQRKDVKIKRGRRKRNYAITQKIFGIPGLLSRRYFSRSRKKYRITIFSLTMSIILFVVTVHFCNYLKSSTVDNSGVTTSYDISYERMFLGEDGTDIYETLKSTDGVDDIKLVSEYVLPQRISVDIRLSHVSISELSLIVAYVDNDTYKALLEKTGEETIDGGILCGRIGCFFYTEEENGSYKREYKEVDVFDVMPDAFESDGRTFKVGALTNAFFLEQLPRNPYLVYPIDMMSEQDKNELDAYYCISSDKLTPEELEEKVKTVLYDYGIVTPSIYNPNAYMKERLGIIEVVSVFCYGFIVLMSLICIANVFNTISTNVALRRRDMAMLRSMGMDDGGIRKMMIYECFCYGFRAMIVGIPVSVFISMGTYVSIMGERPSVSGINFISLFVAVFGAVVVVAISMVYAIRKIKDDNLADELKESGT